MKRIAIMKNSERRRSLARPLRLVDLVQSREANLPTAGRYDHVAQELKGYDYKFAQNAMVSSTQFDGEKS
jgi:hypothetical protein